MAKTMKGLDDYGNTRKGRVPRGSLDDVRTIKENVPKQLAASAAKATGKAIIKCLTDRKCR